ncbi:MAG TPA: hypothetical protein VHF89_16190 [Solirubrobacteraceae bacterium]|nr:hypothetical protein [Solirubrobacteraceae bacterium]
MRGTRAGRRPAAAVRRPEGAARRRTDGAVPARAAELQQAVGNAALARALEARELARQVSEEPAATTEEPTATSEEPAGTTAAPACPFPVDDVTFFEQMERTWPLFGRSVEVPVWSASVDLGWLGSLELSLTAGAGAEASFLTSLGPGVIRDICLDADPATASVAGSGTVVVPADAGPELTVTGSLRGSADYLGTIPLAALVGALQARGTAHGHPEAVVAVRVGYTDGRLTFSAAADLSLSLQLAFDLDASLAAELFGEEAWSGSWTVFAWQWERVWNVLGRLTVGMTDGVADEPRLELVADDVAVEEVLPAILADLIVADEIVAGIRGSTVAAEVPMLEPMAAAAAQAAIAAGEHGVALDIVLRSLPLDTSLFTIEHVPRDDEGEGTTTTEFGDDNRPVAPSRVQVFTPAFASLPVLVSTVMHEYQHVVRDAQGLEPAEVRGEPGASEVAAEVHEVEAYLWELEHALETGLAGRSADLLDIVGRLREHYDALGELDAERQALYTRRVRSAIASAEALASCVANENLGERADPFISRCRKASIRREFPSELLQETLGAIKRGSSAAHKKAWKLLNDNRFKK